MKIEITPLDGKALLNFLRDPQIRDLAVKYYALPPLERLVAAIEAAEKEQGGEVTVNVSVPQEQLSIARKFLEALAARVLAPDSYDGSEMQELAKEGLAAVAAIAELDAKPQVTP